MVRGALATLLALEEDIEVVAQCSRGDEGRGGGAGGAPRRGAARYRDARARRAQGGVPPPPGAAGCTIIILTTFGRPGYLRRAMEAGATGFVVKDGPADQLAVSIRRAVAGERVIDTALAAAALSDGSNPLTPRERDVLHAASEARPSRRSRPRCSCPRVRFATTCRRRSRRRVRATVSRPFARPSSTAGCSRPGSVDVEGGQPRAVQRRA